MISYPIYHRDLRSIIINTFVNEILKLVRMRGVCSQKFEWYYLWNFVSISSLLLIHCQTIQIFQGWDKISAFWPRWWLSSVSLSWICLISFIPGNYEGSIKKFHYIFLHQTFRGIFSSFTIEIITIFCYWKTLLHLQWRINDLLRRIALKFAKNFVSIAPNLHFCFPNFDKSKQNGKFLKKKHPTS